MYQAAAIFLVTLALTGAAAAFVERLRRSLSRPIVWLAILSTAGALSGLSTLVAITRHAGTGFTTSHGWPKPFYFRYLSETGERSDGWSLIYFFGNSLAFTGAVLTFYTVWRLSRR